MTCLIPLEVTQVKKEDRINFMDSETSSSSVNGPQEASNLDELFMQQSLLFSDSLKDLKNLRRQLYSAAEYFELSYCKDDQKQLVVETLKDYATKALISTVDHLGSIAYKVNNFLDEKVDEISGTELRFSCVEQRLRTCQDIIDRGGLYQQSSVVRTPKYYKGYIIPVGETIHAIDNSKSIYNSCVLRAQKVSHQSKNTLQAAKVQQPRSPLIRKGHSRLPSRESPACPGAFSFTRIASNKELGKRAISPLWFPLNRSGSLVSRPITPNSFNAKQQWPSEHRRTVSLPNRAEKERAKEMEQHSKRSRRLLKALLSMSKSKKDDRVYRYIDGGD
ncbi:protein ABIL2-like isoform X2 [Cornus florida]|uniref:protein ABIL2-like isoform X2 n=1 Tax=Cornus florida TaxID=4283 RepID=UPI002899D9BE|nr:protein ABIL2-like isoform X2 [Cornus florida]